jgi:ABC-2 type transport system ATP-binding protein
MAAIEINGISKRFRSVQAVRDLSFTVEAGRVTGFLGPNGAGKSTTLRMLLGLVRPDAGNAGFDGRRYEELPHPSARVGTVLEDASFHPGRSGRNHLRVLAAAGRHPQERVDHVLAQVDLTGAANRRVKGYSMGMRQRLAIAAALLGDPEVLVLDEPANGLDPPGIRWMRNLLRSQAARGRAVLVSSHMLSEVAQSVDDVVVISHGVLRGSGPLDHVLGSSEGPMTRVRSARRAAAPERHRGRARRHWRARRARGGARGGGRGRGRARDRSRRARRGLAFARGRVLRAHRGGSMRALLEAELIKLRTTRTFAALVCVAVGLSVVLTGLVAALTEPTEDSVLIDVFQSDTSGLFIVILAIVGISGEWRHRTITSSLLAAPDRLAFLAAKTLAFAVAGAALSVLISIMVAAVGFSVLEIRGLPTPDGGELVDLYARNAVVAALGGAFGVAIGALVRNQAVAVVGVLLLAFAIEPALVAFAPEVARFSPISVLPTAVTDIDAEQAGLGEIDLLAPGVALLLLLGWNAVLFAGGAGLLRSRDVD